jgi:excisionase family DNA binding protein
MLELLTVNELSKILKISSRTLYRMIDDEQLPFAIKLGGIWRFKKEDVEKWIELKKDHS